jgi:Mrp family chromosome partitioning ATPase
MGALIREVTEEFDLVLFDSPPVLPVTDAAVLASQVDGVVLVYQLGRAGRGLLRRAKSHLETVQADLRGVILNDIKAEVSEFSSAEYYYQYYSRYAEGENTRPRNRLNQAVAGVRERLIGRTSSSKGKTASGPSASRTEGASEYEDVLGITGDRDRSSD